jgi:CheY-like chemotaxis protein
MPAHTVLIIDDAEPIREGVRLILEDAGVFVLEARDGREGLDLLRQSDTPLVVLLDLMMPHMSGVELLYAVAAEPEFASRDAYIIFSAAHALTAATLRSFLLGKRMFYLPKPFDINELVSIVEQAALVLDSDAVGGETEVDAQAPAQMPRTRDTLGGT